METFDPIRHELEAKHHQLEHDLKAAQDHVKVIEADLERVDEALGALTGQKKKGRGRRSRKKPVPSVTELQQHIEHVRQGAPFADANALLESVRSLVRESGSSLSGFKSLFAEALAGSPGSESHSSHASHSGHSTHSSQSPSSHSHSSQHGSHHGHRHGHGHSGQSESDEGSFS